MEEGITMEVTTVTDTTIIMDTDTMVDIIITMDTGTTVETVTVLHTDNTVIIEMQITIINIDADSSNICQV